MKQINKCLISTLIIMLLLTGCNNKETNHDVNINNNQEKENEVIEKKGHTLDSNVGKFIVDKDGSVYYENYKNINYMGSTYNLTETNLSVLGTKQQYTNYTYQTSPICNIETDGCTIEAYKLDLTNISSAYEVPFGNGGSTIVIILLSYDGKVHELKFELASNKVELSKDVSSYKDIVSVVPNMSFGGQGTILIDKNGNKYNYYS